MSRTRDGANFRTGARAMKPSAGLSSSVSAVFTTTTSGISANPGGFQLVVQQEPSGETYWTIPAIGQNPSITLSTSLRNVVFNLGGILRSLVFNGAQTYESLYDFYRIDRVEVLMYAGTQWVADVDAIPGSTSGAADYTQPVFIYAVDSNDNQPVTQANLLSYANVQMKQCAINAPIQLSYKPAAEAQLGNVTAVQGAGPVFSPKIGTATPAVQHYGIKMCPMGLGATPSGSTSIGGVCFIVKQYVTFFDRRST